MKKDKRYPTMSMVEDFILEKKPECRPVNIGESTAWGWAANKCM